ncbi:MAG: hypothetical protein U0531_13940 [Dehalococcoidia bacterium]
MLGSASACTKTGTVRGPERVTIETPDEPARRPSALDLVLGHLRRYLSIVLVGAPLLLPAALGAAGGGDRPARAAPAQRRHGGALGIVGFIAMWVVVVIAIIGLAIVFGFLGFGRLLGASVFGCCSAAGSSRLFVMVALFFAQAVVGLLGRLALMNAGAGGADVRPLALGVLVVVALTALPIVGGVLGFIVFILGWAPGVGGRGRRERATGDGV